MEGHTYRKEKKKLFFLNEKKKKRVDVCQKITTVAGFHAQDKGL
jgi:hypothetical protein